MFSYHIYWLIKEVFPVDHNVVVFYLYFQTKISCVLFYHLYFQNVKNVFVLPNIYYQLSNLSIGFVCFYYPFWLIFIPVNSSFKNRFWLLKQFSIILNWQSYDWNIKCCICHCKLCFSSCRINNMIFRPC